MIENFKIERGHSVPNATMRSGRAPLARDDRNCLRIFKGGILLSPPCISRGGQHHERSLFRRRSQHADPDKVQARYEKGGLPITIAAGAASASA
ncbi:hypothetical protein [Burkholderia ubonensis]|uniref:hypothetical protein n=1 Tax=Burkholderia ubonensis TaxID=101571 RepID=UPI002AB09F1D|nr:hypothetical protein [Burkholderia ubonensis]